MSLAGLSLRDLEYLLAVAEHRHFGRAAEHCGVSQPALSAQIRKLEGLLGLAVFERLPALRAVLRVAVDIRTIDVPAASAAGVLVTRARPGFVAAVSELALGMMISANWKQS